MIKKILVSQPQPDSEKSPYYEIARRHNVEIVFRPFIKVVPVTPTEFRTQHISILEHTSVVFTSRHSIDHYFALCEAMRLRIPDTTKFFCLTESIALYIQKYIPYRKRRMLHGTTGKIEGLIPTMLKHKSEKFLIPVSDANNGSITSLLDAHGLNHTEAVMFRTASNDFTPEEKFDYDMLVFFSPSGIQSLLKNFPDFEQKDIVIATFGPTTAKSVEEAGLRLDLQAPTPEHPSITSALNSYLLKVNGD